MGGLHGYLITIKIALVMRIQDLNNNMLLYFYNYKAIYSLDELQLVLKIHYFLIKLAYCCPRPHHLGKYFNF